MLESADRADSNSAVRKDVWVQVPPAVPGPADAGIECRASPQDPARCTHVGALSHRYPYLLGIYLGDGMLTRARRDVWRLRISLDSKYPGIIDRVKASILDVGTRQAGAIKRQGCVELYSNWKHWICLFPQHAAGAKHERQIALERWQRGLVSSHPEEFLAGLIHSDGCRCINRVKGFEYPRYFFTNLSADIRDLFVQACAMVAVDCRPAGSRNVSVARKDSVALLDRLVGPKS